MGKLFARFFILLIIPFAFSNCGTPNVSVSLSLPKVQTDASCTQAYQQTVCDMIAMVPSPVCQLTSFSDGAAMPSQPVSASGANTCVATQNVDLALCQLGYSASQVESAQISCN